MNYTDGELQDQAAHALGLFLDGTEKWEPLVNQAQADMIEQRLGLDVQRPKYKGFGTTCSRYTVFREDEGEQTRRAIVLAAAEIGRLKPVEVGPWYV